MDRRSWILFGLLAAFWGASYMFIKLGLEGDLSPGMIVFGRTLLASLVLLPVAASRHLLGGLRGRLGAVAVMGALQVAGPFLLITFGERHIASSLAGILVSAAPIFTALLAIWIDQEERVRGVSLLGVAAGMAGVVLLVGVDTGGDDAALVGGLMVLLASLGYALGSFYLKRNLRDVPPVALGASTMAAAALITAPFGLATFPDAVPAFKPIAAVVVLGVVGTGFAFWIFYTLIGELGPAKASLVAYVAPGFSVVYGVTLLDESFNVATAAGLVLIVGGSWVAAEGRFPGRRAVPVEAPEPVG